MLGNRASQKKIVEPASKYLQGCMAEQSQVSSAPSSAHWRKVVVDGEGFRRHLDHPTLQLYKLAVHKKEARHLDSPSSQEYT